MYILDINKMKRRSNVRIICSYLLITALCMLFSLVYEQFSYGEYSIFMRSMFLIPLAGGVLPSVFICCRDKGVAVPRISFNLWNSGIAVLVSGCLVKGIIEISGRYTAYDRWYWIVGGGFLAGAVGVRLCRRSG